MSPDIEAAKELLREGKVWHAVQQHINHYSAYQVGVWTAASWMSSKVTYGLNKAFALYDDKIKHFWFSFSLVEIQKKTLKEYFMSYITLESFISYKFCEYYRSKLTFLRSFFF